VEALLRTRTTVFGPLPSFQENLVTLAGLRRQIGIYSLPFAPAYEKRYPYLDRDLLEFIFAIPRSQLVRPGQRRSLMRRALVGIVPNLVLYRKRKAYVVLGPMTHVGGAAERAFCSTEPSLLCSLGVARPGALAAAVQRLRDGKDARIVPLIRALAVEGWLRNLSLHGFLPQLGERRVTSIPLPQASHIAGPESGALLS